MNYNYYNHKNYSENFKKIFAQEEIDKMSYNEKFIKCSKCDKKPESRWRKWDSRDVREGKFYPIAAFRGKNGEEVCHKCASCVKCGKDAAMNDYWHSKHEKTDENPSGEWALYYCNAECFNGTEKPSLPKKEPEKNANCDHCGKWSEIKVSNAFWGKIFCSGNCYELAFARVPTKQSDEISSHCCVCGFRIFGQDRNFAENFKNRKDKKLHFSDRNFHARYCSETCFEKREDKSGVSCSYGDGHLRYNCGSTQSDNSPKPNPAVPKNKQSKNQDNQTRPVKLVVDNENSSKNNSDKFPQKSPNEGENQTLIIDLKTVKLITLTSDNNLVIEFNKTEVNNGSQEVQVISDEQVSSSQDLQKVKSYLQKNGEKSINQQALNSILSSRNVGLKPTDSSDKRALAIGLSIISAVVIGLVSGLLVKRKRKVK